MIRESFNDHWQFKKGTEGMFSILGREQGTAPVTLPHDAMVLEHRDEDCPNANATGFYPGGTYTYFKKFHAAEEDAVKDISFEFEGIYKNAMVYINGDLAGKRPYGYSHFHVNANGFLKYGQENEIEVIAKTGDMPNSRWYSGSGIYRNVHILKADSLHILADGIRITTLSADDGMAVMEIAITLENTRHRTRTARIETLILDADGKAVASDGSPVTVSSGDIMTIRRRLVIPDVQLWGIDSPYLYACLARIVENQKVTDTSRENFGVRTLGLDAKRGLRINGRPVKLRGACIHHDNGVIGACTLERAEQRRAEILKHAGFNAIRSAHHPMSRAMLDACDRIGLLVMDEAFDTWTRCKADYDYGLYFDEWWQKDLEAMVAKDYNHPCVIIYSIGNEIPEAATTKGAALNRKMVEKMHALDDSRYVSNCVNGFLAAFAHMDEIMQELSAQDDALSPPEANENEPAAEINQFMMNIFSRHDRIASSRTMGDLLEETLAGVDIAGYNYMVSRYEKDAKLYPNRVIVGAENYPPQIGRIWKIVKANPHVIGDFTWTGWDYLGESGVGAFSYDGHYSFFKPFPAYLAFCGDIDITGHRRPMSYYREIVFGLRKTPYIAVQRVNRYGQKVGKTQWCGKEDSISSWTWPGHEGQPALIEVFSSAQEVELLLNGRSLGREPVGTDQLFTARFETAYAPGRLEAVGYNEGLETGRMHLETAGEKLYLKIEPDRTQLRADGADLAYLMISVTDDQGNLNTARPLAITAAVEGAGILQGFGSADPFSTENFFDTTRTTFDGKVLAVVRTTKETGEIRATFTTPGCESQQVVLHAEHGN